MKFVNYTRKIVASLCSSRTLGARALVVKDKQVLLIQHTYMKDWYTIGGAVDAGESAQQAVIRELAEEVGVTALSPPALFGVYYNHRDKRDDHVVFFICEHFTETAHISLAEIARKQWFPLTDLPEDTSPATRRRVEEYLGVRPLSDRW
jgi:8-oxo-dGTP pyrophosphatase MutT (NUDIX family)